MEQLRQRNKAQKVLIEDMLGSRLFTMRLHAPANLCARNHEGEPAQSGATSQSIQESFDRAD
jgi:hypothetical protein